VNQRYNPRRRDALTRIALCLLVLIAVSGLPVTSQSAPKFDIVSVKPNKSGETALRLDVQPRGRFMAINMPLKQFIRAAYTLQLYQIADAPSWVDSERFDIVALAKLDLMAAPIVWTPGQYAPMQLMMQAVLADRFKMVAHIEERQAQGYALVLRSSGSTGKLLPATVPCASNCGMKIASGTVSAHDVPLPQFAELLSQLTGRRVIDSTGLTGNFDFEVEWAPESQQAVSDAPSLFTVLQEQLGLRLDPRRVQTPMLVIDSVERPTPD
jgi:uncharacterized protein (TIGR03435 family)